MCQHEDKSVFTNQKRCYWKIRATLERESVPGAITEKLYTFEYNKQT